jgi:hypothetical protein
MSMHFPAEPEKMLFGSADLFGRKPETRRAAKWKQNSAVPQGQLVFEGTGKSGSNLGFEVLQRSS